MNNYQFDTGDDVTNQLEKAEMYWKGRDDGRLEAGGGLPTFICGFFIGFVGMAVICIACKVML